MADILRMMTVAYEFLDAYMIISITCTVYGIIWYNAMEGTMIKLNDTKPKEWQLNFLQKID